MLDRILNRLEEWIIVTLIAAATVLTFVAVVHRYGASNSAGLARWAGAHHLLMLKAAAMYEKVSGNPIEKQAIDSTTIDSTAGTLSVRFVASDSQFSSLLQSPLFQNVVR